MNNLDDLLNKKDYLNSLYDIYKDLFTSKQRAYFESYFFDDLSLGEIATNYNVSRNAVFTSLKSIEESLENYENKLKILEKREKIIDLLDKSDLGEKEKEKVKELL